jgi:tetratricopeptide (TPR) repeat protein
LANHGEVRWRRLKGRNLYPIEEHLLRLALEKGELNASSELEPRLQKLLGPDSTWLHSARVTSQVRFLLSRWGYDMVHRILERISTGADIDGALRETLGLSLVQFHKEWKKYVEVNPPRKLPGIVVRVPQLRKKSPPEKASLPDEETTGPALSHLEAGDLLLEEGNVESSILMYQKALDVCPVSLEGFQKLASAYARGGRADRALETLAKAVSLYPDEAALYIQIAEVYWSQASLEEALTFFSESTRIDPFNPYVYRSRSSIYRQRGMARQAYEEMKKTEIIEEKEGTP